LSKTTEALLIHPPNFNPPIQERVRLEIIRLHADGMSIHEISRQPGMPNRSTCRKYIRRHLSIKWHKPREIEIRPIGNCPVSGGRLFLVESEDHSHIVPEAIVAVAKETRKKWKIAA
jgi:hypothetical protein